ncbi:hypothetical protein EON63_21960 [archaeon]|nr:MAG: hypothetical protein EON63_21960 [archaeon]
MLPIGGVKEKILAAKRAQASIVILPRGNQRDFDELPDYVKQDVQMHFVQDYSEVYKIVFGNVE